MLREILSDLENVAGGVVVVNVDEADDGYGLDTNSYFQVFNHRHVVITRPNKTRSRQISPDTCTVARHT